MSDKTIKEIKAVGEWVVCEAVPAESKVEKTESGLIMPGKKATGQNVNDPNKSGKLIVKYFVVKSLVVHQIFTKFAIILATGQVKVLA